MLNADQLRSIACDNLYYEWTQLTDEQKKAMPESFIEQMDNLRESLGYEG